MIMKQRELKWEIISSEYLIQRPWLTARRDAVRLPNDTVCEEYYVLEYPDWINVIAETVDGQILIERQYRHGHQSVNFEICAGVIESGETPLQAAQRELYEETGYTGGEWTELMTIAPNPGSQTNLCHCFLARGVEKTSRQHLDRTENIEVYTYTKTEVRKMLQRGEFLQAMMVAPLWKYFSQE